MLERMELCIFTEPQQGATYDDLLAIARATEDGGFTGFFRSDHYLAMNVPDGAGPTDAWVSLAGLARDTSRVRLGTLVTSATFRLPGPLAISVAQVDAMSGGRVELGIGAGWYEAEHSAYGIPFPPLGERFDRLEEQLTIIDGLWRTPVGQRFSFDGTYYDVTDSPALPKPVQQPRPPIIVGGTGKKRTPDLAVRFAQEFNVPMHTVDGTAELFDRIRDRVREVGRTEPMRFSAAQVACCGRTDAEVASRAASLGREVDELKENGLAGTPSEVVDKIGRLREIGAERIYFQQLDLYDLDQVELLASEVLPQI